MTRALVTASLFAATLSGQVGTIAGLDGSLTNNASPTYFGRRGPAHPNGEVALGYSYTMCNPGTVPIQWTAPMNANHPMFAMMVVRESNGRMEQITDNTTTYVKHAFSAANTPSTCGGTCQTTGSGLRVQCTDTYGASTNANRFYLAPWTEINPWTGVWNPIGSYFDRGDPDVGAPGNSDGVRSLTATSGGFPTDPVKNRVTLREQDLLAPGRLFHCCHIVVRGEDGDLHWNNTGHREVTAAWNGTTWAFANPSAFVPGTVLGSWAGANLGFARNGEDDGHFVVAVKTTPLAGGLWHYEYAVENFDNQRGGATLRIPVNPTTPVTNITFRDPNGDPLDDWTTSRQGSELVFSASATNPLRWNSIYNFGFDCDRPPEPGTVAIDQALVGPGALTLAINSRVPSGLADVIYVGPGCGSPPPVLSTNNEPLIPSPAFALLFGGQPSLPVLLYVSVGPANTVLSPTCTLYLDGSLIAHQTLAANATGGALSPFPIPDNPSLEGLRLRWQAAQLVNGGPLLGFLNLSNGFELRVATR